MISTLAYVNWTVNPVLFGIVRWYGIFLALGFVLAYLTLQQVFKVEKLSNKLLDQLTIWTVLWTFVGLRIGHFLFYEPEYLVRHPLLVLLPIDENWSFIGYQGLASHGGVLAIILFILYFSWKYKMNILWLLDRMAVVVLVAAGMVRLGNLMNHEIVGSITNVSWAFNFTRGDHNVTGNPRHPTQLYEAIVYFITYGTLAYYYFKITKKNVPPGRIVGILLIVVFGSRFLIEFLKEIQVAKESTMNLNIGQWLSIPFVLLGIFFLVYSIVYRKKISHYVEVVNEKEKSK